MHVRQLESALVRERRLRDTGTLKDGTTVQDLIERNARIEANAALTISNLVQEVAAAEGKLSVTGLPLPGPSVGHAAMLPAVQHVPMVADHDTAKSFAVLYAREKELNAYRAAVKNLQMFAHNVASQSSETLAAGVNQVITEAKAVLQASSTDQVDLLPDGWEV